MNELKWMNWKEWIAKSAPNPEVFFHLFVIELVLQSRGHFVDLIFQKCSEPRKFYDLLVKSSSCFGLVDIFVDLIFQKCSEPCSFFTITSEIELLLQSRAHFVDHFPAKNIGFRARECFQAWIHAFPIAQISYLMMIWLTWWCGCHGVETASHDNRP